jgi:ATP-dependent helicase/nuclease subunit A
MAEMHYTRNARPCSAPEFYDAACDPLRHVVVEACAGAGKTWVLVARIARALLLGAQPDSILAITFTKKAAGDMRKRLLELLVEWSTHDDAALTQSLVERGVSAPSAEVMARARGLYDTLLASERSLQVRTFHSWFAQLLRHAPLEAYRALQLPPQHELLEDDSQAKADVWPLFLARVQADADLRAEYFAAVSVAGRDATQDALMAALDKRLELALADEAGALETSVAHPQALAPRLGAHVEAPDVLSLVPGFAQALWSAARSLGQHTKSKASVRSAQDLEAALTANDVRAAQKVLRTQSGTPRKTGLTAADPETIALAQDWMGEWMDARHQWACWQHQQRMVHLSRALVQTYSEMKLTRGWVDMNDLERAAAHLLADGTSAAWIQQRLDQTLAHVLIDEFQDTNPLQWRALHAWLEAYAGAGGGGVGPRVFIVGDPKQSIYRFRRADPRVFRQAADFVSQALGADLLACDHTRRCAPQVVQAINAVMAATPRVGETAVDYRAHSTASTQVGQLDLLPLVTLESEGGQPNATDDPLHWRDTLSEPRDAVKERVAQHEAERAADILVDLVAKDGVPWGKVMVLARQNARLALLHQALRERGVASAFTEKTPLIEAPVVSDVVALLDAATAHHHDLSLAQALKSPLLGASDDDLMALALQRRALQSQVTTLGPDGKPSVLTWWDLLQSGKAASVTPPLRTPEDWRAQCAAWAQLLSDLDQRLQTVPVHDVLVWLFGVTEAHARYATQVAASLRQAALSQLNALLDASQNLGSGRFLTPHRFVREIKASTQQVSWPLPADAVRLMTVHGAKGLEAEVVVILDAHAPPQKAQSMGVFMDWPLADNHPRRLVFVAREKAPPLCAKDLLAQEQLARQAEDANLLYVAMTRAERRLVVSGHQGSRDAGHSWYQQLHTSGIPISTMSATRAPHAQSHDAPVGVKSLPTWAPLLSVAPATEETDQALALRARMGQALHKLLQWYSPDRPWGATTLTALGQNFELDATALSEVVSMAHTVTRGEAAWCWDPAVVDVTHAEVELGWHGDLLRLDRVVRRRDTGEWWVLDFKSSQAPTRQEALVTQVKDYAQAWSAIQVHADPSAQAQAPVRAAMVGGNGRLWVLT